MITNPAAAMRMLITYAICIPVAVFLGYMLTEVGTRPDFSNLSIVGLMLAMLLIPVFIKWHYPLLYFAASAPIYCFFLMGKPPLSQVIVFTSLGIAIVERALNSDRRFLSARCLTWPLLFLAAVVLMTMELTGGISLNALTGGAGVAGGGKKYIALFAGIAIYFALTSRPIPPNKRNLYVALFFLPGLLSVVSDLFPYLPAPLNYINLLIPPTTSISADLGAATTRFASFGATAGVLASFMLVKYGLRGIFMDGRLWRVPAFVLFLVLTLFGGFRINIIWWTETLLLLFFIERLYRTRMLLVAVMTGLILITGLVTFSNKLPYSFQRSLSFLPLQWEAAPKMDAEGSAEWRYRMWRDLWPKVPQYLLLGKGYSLTAEDFMMMGTGTFSGGYAVQMDASNEALAISGDYHSGPLSTLIPFGVWGAIGILWLMAACLWVHYRNFRYSSPELKTVNTFLLVMCITHCIGFYFIVGAFSGDVGELAKTVGFCLALNGGVLGPKTQPRVMQPFKPLAVAQPA